MKSFNLKIQDKIAILEFDQPDSKVNVLNTDSMKELAGIIDELGKKPKTELEALIIVSKKDGIFIAGADIKEIENISSEPEARLKAEKGKEVLDALSRLKLATIAVINGACLGGGLELALACKYRTASFSDKVKIGLPEVKLGIIPGFGGTQRLPRLVGLVRSLGMILSGDIINARDALRYGLVNRLFPDVSLAADSIAFVKNILSGKEKVERKKKKFSQIFLEETPVGRWIIFRKAKKNILKQTKGFYPAPISALDVIRRTYGWNLLSLARNEVFSGLKGSSIESDYFARLAITEICKNLIKIFYLFEKYKKFSWLDDSTKGGKITKCGVVGAGIMGGGIAQLVSFNNIPVRIKDINYEALKTSLKTAYGLFESLLRKRKLKEHDVNYRFGLISPTLTYKGFKNASIIIEAVVEDLAIKKAVFKELGEVTLPDTVLASNTSTLPIINISEETRSPERVVGLHFFNPVHRMPLVEVIKSDRTSNHTIIKTIDFARRLGKLVIVVKDVPGFLINRILLTYLNEAGFLVEEGMGMEKVDKLARLFGMPMGPIELIDEIGIDVGYKVAKILEASYGQRMRVCSILEKAKASGLVGKKTGRGFYIYKGKKKWPNNKGYRSQRSEGRSQRTRNLFSDLCPLSSDTALKRMIYTMINEASRCLEEGVVTSPEVVDIGMIAGTGFPPFRAGLLRYADSVRINNIVKELKVFETKYKAPRFTPCKYLLVKAEKGEGFY